MDRYTLTTAVILSAFIIDAAVNLVATLVSPAIGVGGMLAMVIPTAVVALSAMALAVFWPRRES